MGCTTYPHGRDAAVGVEHERHLALLYGDDAEYRDGLMSFFAPAIAAGEPMAAAVPPERGQMLRELVRGAGGELEILDMYELGRNPARIIPSIESMLATSQGSVVHYVGESVWPGRSQEEIHEVNRHEALLNVACPGVPVRVLCPYNAAALDADVLADAERTHPRVIKRGRERASDAYEGAAVPAENDHALPAPPPDARVLPFGPGDLRLLRTKVSEWAQAGGLRGQRVADLVLAVNELATNSIRHGRGRGVLHVWAWSRRIVCQIHDSGGSIEDPLAGRRIPKFAEGGGIGLWTVNQLCDLVQMRTRATGTTVRVHAMLD